jgi:16S rRNA U516 pseudouridylate synthase RsuA-like enzyme
MIRETAKALELRLERINRVRLANPSLGEWAGGDWRELTKSEIMNLLSGMQGPEWISPSK